MLMLNQKGNHLKKLGLGLVLATLLSAGCKIATEGQQGNVLFEPRGCGLLICAFSKGLAVGGVMESQISGIDNYPTAGLNLVSGDPSLLDVYAVADVNGRATWGLTGLREGTVELDVVDANNVRADFIRLTVSTPDSLSSELFTGQGGPKVDTVVQEIWPVTVGDDMRFDVVPQLRGSSLMGNMVYSVNVDAALDNALLPDADVGLGHIYFNPPTVGDYSISLVDSNGVPLDILFQAQ